MTISTQPYKGARDFYPEDMRLQKYMFGVIRSVCERFGYEEYDAPILEPTELYLSKGNEEIINEQTYTFVDRGNRKVTMRTEMTPSVTRMVAARQQELSYPLRWYSIPQCWRYERTQRGRGREFYQLNVDIFGVDTIDADHEIVLVADDILQAFGAKRDMYVIQLNSRKLTDYILGEYVGLNEVQTPLVRNLVDRINKLPAAEFEALLDGILSQSQRDNGAAQKLLDVIRVKNFTDLPEDVRQHPSAAPLLALMTFLESTGVTNAVYDASLMRGFEYYTDIVFEMTDTHPDNNRSVCGGGRYDGLMELFSTNSLSAVGYAMGDIPLQNFLESHGLLPEFKPETELAVVIVGNIYPKAYKTISQLREMGVKVSVDFSTRKPDKQLKAVLKRGVRFVLFIGEQELADEQFTLKDLKNNTEEKRGLQRIVTTIKDYRK